MENPRRLFTRGHTRPLGRDPRSGSTPLEARRARAGTRYMLRRPVPPSLGIHGLLQAARSSCQPPVRNLSGTINHIRLSCQHLPVGGARGQLEIYLLVFHNPAAIFRNLYIKNQDLSSAYFSIIQVLFHLLQARTNLSKQLLF